MKVSVIIVNFNVKYFLEVCLHSVLRALEGIEGEIIVVDNDSKDGSVAFIKQRFPSVQLIANKDNKGFSKANNQGVRIAQGEYILFLNPDTVLPENFFKKTIEYMDAHPKAGCLGPKLLDGKGQYAPESKRSFPSLSVAVFKTTGINKLFKNSSYFNKYYAVHVGENEVASVDVLMGCCMMIRKSILQEIGVAFDEDFFMYGEDIDLSYRIQKAGYKNIYFPEVSIIHYKGESTKKSSFSYVRIFNEALSLFVKKNYPKASARVFNAFINVGILLRAIVSLFKNLLSILKMPLLDTIILFAILWFVKEFYLMDIKNYRYIPTSSLLATIPVYIGLWILSMFLNGVYEQSYNPLRVIRGMAIGTVLALAYYGLLQMEFRYSRSIIIFTAFGGTAIMLAAHEILYQLNIFKFIPYNKISKKNVVVANEKNFLQTKELLRKINYPLDLFGQVAPTENENRSITDLDNLCEVMYQTSINEVIFCADDLSYATIIEQMKKCGKNYEYKIHLSGSDGFVGSNSRHTSGDVYTSAPKYNLSHSYHIRNKRFLDIGVSFLLLIFFPVLIFFIRSPNNLFSNCIKVFRGKLTYIGYSNKSSDHFLPHIKKSILPNHNVIENTVLSDQMKNQLDVAYATNYSVAHDIKLVLKNFKFLGRKS